jgi:hypothetical protein
MKILTDLTSLLRLAATVFVVGLVIGTALGLFA